MFDVHDHDRSTTRQLHSCHVSCTSLSHELLTY
jgi:hypothetical protein